MVNAMLPKFYRIRYTYYCYTLPCAQWSYGVTVWEVFNGGRTPYPAVDPHSLIQLLGEGRRLERPLNTACATEM